MKKLISLLCLFLTLAGPAFGAVKISELTEETAPITTDLAVVVDDPAGSPVTKKVTLANLSKGLNASNIANGQLPVAYGGTGSATAAAARTALGLAIGTNVQAYDGDLDTYAGITPAANVQSILGAADYAAIRALLDLEAGTDFYSISAADAAFQPLDSDLTYLAGFTPSANVKTILNAADYAAVRTALSLVVGTNVQAYDADLTTYAGITPAANVQSILGAADYAAIRTLLGLVIGTNVQAYDADLTTYAGITPAANVQSILGAADYAAIRALLDLEAGTDFYSVSAADAAFQPLDAELTVWATIKVKHDATTAPTADNDTTEGYVVGSRWIDVTNDKEYVCLDATDTAAVWTETTGAGGSVGDDHIDALTEIAQAIKSAADDSSKLVVGTPGSTDDCAKWSATGALVSAGAACGTATLSADSVGTSELDDGADTPASGEYVRVDTVDQAGFEYRTAAETRTDLGLVIGTNVQAYDSDLTTYAGITPAANVQSILGAADYAAIRALLDLEAGTDFYSISAADAAFQPLDSDLTTYAGITPSANVQTFLGYANFAAMQAGLSIDDLITLSGVSEGATHLGTFTGTTISDNGTIKAGMQELETALEASSGSPGGSDTQMQYNNGGGFGGSFVTYDDASGSEIQTVDSGFSLGTVETFAQSDATPNIDGGAYWNTHTTTVTFTDFDGGNLKDGQVVIVYSKGAMTYDCTGAGFRCGSTDIVTADGDVTAWQYDGTDWILQYFMDNSVDMHPGGGGSDTNSVKEYYWPAAALLPLEHVSENLAPLEKEQGTNQDVMYRSFDDTTRECAAGTFKVPSDIDTSGTVTFYYWWDADSDPTSCGSSCEVIWETNYLAVANDEGWDQALTQLQADADSTSTTHKDVMLQTDTDTVSNLGWSGNELIYFEVCRSPATAGDDLNGDANLHGYGVGIPRI